LLIGKGKSEYPYRQPGVKVKKKYTAVREGIYPPFFQVTFKEAISQCRVFTLPIKSVENSLL
jgi:hypothetical protein